MSPVHVWCMPPLKFGATNAVEKTQNMFEQVWHDKRVPALGVEAVIQNGRTAEVTLPQIHVMGYMVWVETPLN